MTTLTTKLESLIKTSEAYLAKYESVSGLQMAAIMVQDGENILFHAAMINVATSAAEASEKHSAMNLLDYYMDKLIDSANPSRSTCAVTNLSKEMNRKAIAQVVKAIQRFV